MKQLLKVPVVLGVEPFRLPKPVRQSLKPKLPVPEVPGPVACPRQFTKPVQSLKPELVVVPSHEATLLVIFEQSLKPVLLAVPVAVALHLLIY